MSNKSTKHSVINFTYVVVSAMNGYVLLDEQHVEKIYGD